LVGWVEERNPTEDQLSLAHLKVLSAWGGLDCALNIAKPSLLDWQYAAYSRKLSFIETVRNLQYAPMNSRRFTQWNENKKNGLNKKSGYFK